MTIVPLREEFFQIFSDNFFHRGDEVAGDDGHPAGVAECRATRFCEMSPQPISPHLTFDKFINPQAYFSIIIGNRRGRRQISGVGIVPIAHQCFDVERLRCRG